jgi:hypothetical protein
MLPPVEQGAAEVLEVLGDVFLGPARSACRSASRTVEARDAGASAAGRPILLSRPDMQGA